MNQPVQPILQQSEQEPNQAEELPAQVAEAKEQQAVTKEKGEEVEPVNELFLEDNLEMAQQMKTEGNQLFKVEEFFEAVGKYQAGLRYAGKEQGKLRAILYSNISICQSKMDNSKDALTYCKKAVSCDPDYIKAQLNLATCYEKTDSLEESLTQNKKLLEFYPKDVKFMAKVNQLEKRIEERNEKQKKEVLDGLKNIGNSLLGYFGMSLDNFKLEQGNGGGYNVSFKQ